MRQPHRERAALARACAVGLDAPTVHLHRSASQCKPNPETAAHPLRRRRQLGEQLEDAGKVLGGDAGAGVLDTHCHLGAVARGAQPDATAALGELGGIVEQVREDLGEADRVGVEVDGVGRQRQFQVLAGALDEGPRDLQGLVQHGAQRNPLPAQLQLAAGDPADVEQVVDQPNQVLHLAIEQIAGPLHVRLQRDLVPYDLDGIADRHQQVAQFVRQCREELVLAAIGLAQCPSSAALRSVTSTLTP
jgi:hypothetical protein